MARSQVLTVTLSDPRHFNTLSRQRHSGLSRLGKREAQMANLLEGDGTPMRGRAAIAVP
jgi:hypothetical protein